MMIFSVLLVFPLAYFLHFFCLKKNFLLSLSGEKHQKFISKKNVPLIGGFIILIIIYFLNIDLKFKLYLTLFFCLGFISDLKILSSANIRFFFQSILVVFFVYILDIYLVNTRVILLDVLLQDKFFNLFFTSFCIIIILNGTNFIDGINLNTILYYFLINTILIFLSKDYNLFLSKEDFLILGLSLLFLGYLNSKNILFLGDSGSYLIAIFFSFLLIDFYVSNQQISPFFIILLLWYPGFENLFSIIRKFNFKKSPLKPDIFHLHHLIYTWLDSFKKTKNHKKNLAGILINLFNICLFYLAINNISNSQFQIMLLIIATLIYCFVYLKLLKLKFKNLFRNKI